MAVVEMSLEQLEKELFTEFELMRNAITKEEKKERGKHVKHLSRGLEGIYNKKEHDRNVKSKYNDPDWVAKRESYNNYNRKLTPDEEAKEKAKLLDLINSVSVEGDPMKDDAEIMAMQYGEELDKSGEFLSDDRSTDFPRTSILDKFVYVEPETTDLEQTKTERVI